MASTSRTRPASGRGRFEPPGRWPPAKRPASQAPAAGASMPGQGDQNQASAVDQLVSGPEPGQNQGRPQREGLGPGQVIAVPMSRIAITAKILTHRPLESSRPGYGGRPSPDQGRPQRETVTRTSPGSGSAHRGGPPGIPSQYRFSGQDQADQLTGSMDGRQ